MLDNEKPEYIEVIKGMYAGARGYLKITDTSISVRRYPAILFIDAQEIKTTLKFEEFVTIPSYHQNIKER